jgi:hypothetical protein
VLARHQQGDGQRDGQNRDDEEGDEEWFHTDNATDGV